MASFLLIVLTSSFGWLHSHAQEAKVGRTVGVFVAIALNVLGLFSAVILIVLGTFTRVRMSTNCLSLFFSFLLIISTVAAPSLVAIEFINNKHTLAPPPPLHDHTTPPPQPDKNPMLWLQILFWVALGILTCVVACYLLIHKKYPNFFPSLLIYETWHNFVANILL